MQKKKKKQILNEKTWEIKFQEKKTKLSYAKALNKRLKTPLNNNN
jgi:hypothetical protein